MDYRIIFQNNSTKECSVFILEDMGDKNYYRFPTPQGLSSGEYSYFILGVGEPFELNPNDVPKSTIGGEQVTIFDRGVASVGKDATRVSMYNITKEYEQYGENK